jgi:hypothetical protein
MSSFFIQICFWEYAYFSDFGRTFNEQTIRGRVNSDGGGDGTASILADDNVFTGLNSFTQDLGTTGISNTGNLVMMIRRRGSGGQQTKFMIQDYFTANNRFGFVIRGRTGGMFMSNSHIKHSI